MSTIEERERAEGKRQMANWCCRCRSPVAWAEAKRAYYRLLKAGVPDDVLKSRMHAKCAGTVIRELSNGR